MCKGKKIDKRIDNRPGPNRQQVACLLSRKVLSLSSPFAPTPLFSIFLLLFLISPAWRKRKSQSSPSSGPCMAHLLSLPPPSSILAIGGCMHLWERVILMSKLCPHACPPLQAKSKHTSGVARSWENGPKMGPSQSGLRK